MSLRVALVYHRCDAVECGRNACQGPARGFSAITQEGGEIEQWERVKGAATEAVVSQGGALSHHHGIGGDHRAWMESYLGSSSVRWLAVGAAALGLGGLMIALGWRPRSGGCHGVHYLPHGSCVTGFEAVPVRSSGC